MSDIRSVKGDLLAADAEALINTVNCVGVMGAGLALSFKKNYPDNFVAYESACLAGEVVPGKIFVYERAGSLAGPRFILNFPTKRHWRDPSLLKDVEKGLADLIKVCRERNIRSIAIPPLGCGLGGLDWRIVRPMVVSTLKRLPETRALIYDPPGWRSTPVPAPF